MACFLSLGFTSCSSSYPRNSVISWTHQGIKPFLRSEPWWFNSLWKHHNRHTLGIPATHWNNCWSFVNGWNYIHHGKNLICLWFLAQSSLNPWNFPNDKDDRNVFFLRWIVTGSWIASRWELIFKETFNSIFQALWKRRANLELTSSGQSFNQLL